MKKSVILLGFFFLIQSLEVNAQKTTKGPYLADIASTSISVRWESDKKFPFVLEYGKDKTALIKQKAVLLGKEDGTGYLYEVRLKKITPRIKYFYKIGGKNKSLTPFSFFHTLETGHPSVRFVAMGDSRSQEKIFAQIMKQTEKIAPDIIISMGDLVEEGGEENQWTDQFFNVADSYINHIPFISTLGDHEGDSDNGRLFAHYFYPHKDWTKLWYSFDFGEAHFVSLDYRHADNPEMINWFKQDMKKTKAKWIFVFMHRPCYNFGGHRSMWGRQIWPKLFQQYHIDIVFAGHSHIYERFYPVRPSHTHLWPVTYITTGGAGAELYDISQSVFLAKTDSVHHFIVFDIKNDSLSMKVYSLDGSVIDTLNIKKKNGKYDKDYIKTVKPQEELDLITMFLNAISDSISSVPLYDEPAKRILELQSPDSLGNVDFRISLSPESSENYKMKTISGTLRSGEKQQIQLKIFSKGPMTFSEWGEISPALKLECEVKLNNNVIKIKGGNLEYWPED